jgi:cell wall-associated NlpC family hydrolase
VDEADVVDRAIAWALARVGREDYGLKCLSFVEDAYEQANSIEVFGGASASESAELYDAAASRGQPPAGSFVFFETSGIVDGVRRDWGHVGLAIGDGLMVSPWSEVRVDKIEDFPSVPSGSWTKPVYIGFAAPSRVLQGARSRSKTTGFP